ncbi:MAG: class I SAM-dependent methyltransferase [Chloroflexota bacterium]
MSFRDIETPDDVAAYELRLRNGYPERPFIIAQICDHLKTFNTPNPVIAELCVGPGVLAEALCRAFPQIRYVGLDFMQPFLDYAAKRLPASVDATFVQADLTGANWVERLREAGGENGRYHAIVSLQSLHDVGGVERSATIYKECRTLLNNGGLFINADLITAIGDEVTARPGRLTTQQHLTLLEEAGFVKSKCDWESGGFGIYHGFTA